MPTIAELLLQQHYPGRAAVLKEALRRKEQAQISPSTALTMALAITSQLPLSWANYVKGITADLILNMPPEYRMQLREIWKEITRRCKSGEYY